MKRLSLFVLFLFVVMMSSGMEAFAQTDARGDTLWYDDFEDDDLYALKNVGWIHYGPPLEEDIVGQIVEQRNGELFLQSGLYQGLVPVSVIETNGVPELIVDENYDLTPEGIDSLLANHFSDPNLDLTFQVNFSKLTTTMFVVGLRLVQMDPEDRPDANPTDSPAYTVIVSPMEDWLNLAKYDTTEQIVLFPDQWTYFTEPAVFDFELGVYYYFRVWLNEADFKVKVWEGELDEEPEEWLIEIVDPDPRVTGKFMMFGMMGADEDKIMLDNIVARSTEAAAAHPVTFRVNMSVQQALGNFDPAVDKVVVRGGFNGWAGNDTECTLGATADVYEGIFEFTDADVGVEQAYKFVMVNGSDRWESDPHRTLVPQTGGQVLDVVYFDRRESVGVTATIRFQGDCSELITKGYFNPATDSLRIVGGFNGWANDESMVPDLLDPSLYLYETDITAETGTDYWWKFRGYPNDHFIDSGWEGGDGHLFTFTGEDLVLDKVKPDIYPAGTPLAQDVTVRFSVDCSDAYDWFNKQPFPTVDGVYLNGDFVPLGAGGWGGWTVADTAGPLIKMYDDGVTGGDATAGDNIWTTEVPFATSEPSGHVYKYGIYSAGYTDTLNAGVIPMDNEAGFAKNHVILIGDASPLFVNEKDYFGSQWRETSVELIPSEAIPADFVLKQNYPNPFNPVTEINFSLPTKSHVNLTVYNALGQKIATLVDSEHMAGSYRVTWDAVDATSGVYFYRLESEGFAKTMKMMLMK